MGCTCTHLPTGSIHGLLGGSVGVDSGHETLNDAKFVIDHLRQRSKAVGGTGGVAREKSRQVGWYNLQIWALTICDNYNS